MGALFERFKLLAPPLLFISTEVIFGIKSYETITWGSSYLAWVLNIAFLLNFFILKTQMHFLQFNGYMVFTNHFL